MTWDDVLLYQSTLTTISKLSWTQLVNLTGCHAKCTWNRYSFNKVGVNILSSYIHQQVLQISEETIHWKTLSSSSFFLSAEKTLVKTEEELLTFDHEDLINGLGGALGLFLGWSLLYIFQQCFKMARHMRGWSNKIRDKILTDLNDNECTTGQKESY